MIVFLPGDPLAGAFTVRPTRYVHCTLWPPGHRAYGRDSEAVISYVVRRILLAIPLLWGVLTIVFMGFHLLPGDPAQQMLIGHGTAQDVARLRHVLGLDRPMLVQYWDFISHAAHLDFGRS